MVHIDLILLSKTDSIDRFTSCWSNWKTSDQFYENSQVYT